MRSDKSKIDELLVNLGMPVDLLSWFEEDDRSYDYAPIDEETRSTLNDM